MSPATFNVICEERDQLKRMLKLAKSLPESDVRDRTIHRIEVELLYLKLKVNSEDPSCVH